MRRDRDGPLVEGAPVGCWAHAFATFGVSVVPDPSHVRLATLERELAAEFKDDSDASKKQLAHTQFRLSKARAP